MNKKQKIIASVIMCIIPFIVYAHDKFIVGAVKKTYFYACMIAFMYLCAAASLVSIPGERKHSERFEEMRRAYPRGVRYKIKSERKHGTTAMSDLAYRYRSRGTMVPLAFGAVFFAAGAAGIIHRENPAETIAALVLGIAALAYAAYRIIAVPARRFYLRLIEEYGDAERIDEDYIRGDLFTYSLSGVNIGREYIFIFSDNNVTLTETGNISSVIYELADNKQEYQGMRLWSVYECILRFEVKCPVKNMKSDTSDHMSITLDRKKGAAVIALLKQKGFNVLNAADKEYREGK